MASVLSDPFYYLENFRRVVAWVSERHDDLLDDDERALIALFSSLPRASQALLVRMVMRKGDLFRRSKLDYAEIGDTALAIQALANHGFVDIRPALALEQLFGLLKKNELLSIFGSRLKKTGALKNDLLADLLNEYPEARSFADWCPTLADTVYQLTHVEAYDRLRLLFFGNLHQDWSEFVLADLGIVKYEKVDLSAASRAFRQRSDVDDYLHLSRCRERLEEGESVTAILTDIPVTAHANPWLDARRAKLLFQLGQQQEKQQDRASALAIYQSCMYPQARIRTIRVLENDAQFEAAFSMADALLETSRSEEEKQQLLRILPRLRRKLGKEKLAALTAKPPERMDMVLNPLPGTSVEMLVCEHLQGQTSPVFYVENTLINSLFGLLCWPAVFTPVPGAFFHPFHYGPADLHTPDFHLRREAEFSRCLNQLESSAYRETILSTYREKSDTQSPFVFWSMLSEELLTVALDCIPATHLRKLFERILRDVKANRSGFPDLIQFWPQEKRYRMLEVKGPGDRLQDNQIRWLDYCGQHGIPVSVCYVQWPEETS